jgi:hypothetical protein
MKKYLIGIIFIYSHVLSVEGQKTDLKLTIAGTSATCAENLSDLSLRVVLKIENVGAKIRQLPVRYLFTAEGNKEGNIFFEILYCSTDTFNITKDYSEDILFSYKSLLSSSNIYPSESHYEEGYIPKAWFNKLGVYLIRVAFRSDIYNKDMPVIYSQWVRFSNH